MKKFKLFSVIILFLLIFSNIVNSQNDSNFVKKFTTKLDFSMQSFLAYRYNFHDNSNSFLLKRGYFTLKAKLNPLVSVRYTQDITLDDEGDDAGNIEFRLKYLYLNIDAPKNSFLEGTFIELGMVHRPWLDFEENINRYRAQGEMFVDKYDILPSADLGFMIGGNLGKELSEEDKKIVGEDYAGKYGSFAFGIYNGGGYHSMEYNNNKVLEARLSLRPIPNLLPGLMFSYVYSYGKPNLNIFNIEYFQNNLFVASLQTRYFTIAGQYTNNKGNFMGTYYNINALENVGYSFFGEIKIPKTDFSVIVRYDDFEILNTDYEINFYGGIAYKIMKSKLLLFYRNLENQTEVNNIIEFTLEIAF